MVKNVRIQNKEGPLNCGPSLCTLQPSTIDDISSTSRAQYQL